MKKIILVLSALSFALSSYSQGLFESALSSVDTTTQQSTPINGFIRSVCYAGNNSDNNAYIQSIYSQFGIKADIDFGKFGKGVADFRYRYGNQNGESLSEMELHRAYVDLYLNALKLRLGKQALNWGGTSFMNPTDQFTPKNPAYRSPDVGDMNLGHWMVNAELAISSSSSLQLIYIPIYEPSPLLSEVLPTPDFMSFNETIPSNELGSGSFGFNYDLRSRALDMSLSFYHGYRNFPAIRFDTATFNPTSFAPEQVILNKDPYRINTVGLNLTVPVADYLFRIEGNYLNVIENDDITYPSLSEISYAAEIEQTGSSITIIGGYYGKYVIDYKAVTIEPGLLTGEFPDLMSLFPAETAPDLETIDSYLTDQIAGINKLYEYQAKEFYHSVYAIGKISLFNDVVDLEVPGMYNFTTKEITVMPSLTFSITDNLKFQTGAYILYGEENSLFDLVGPNLNAAYLLLKASF